MKKNKHDKKPVHIGGSGRYWIYGKHPVIAAINNPKRNIFKVSVTNDNLTKDLSALLKNRKIPFEIVSKNDFDSFLPKDAVHQGIAVDVNILENLAIEDICVDNENALVVILDQVTDPHNIGAIMRSAAAFDVDAVIVPDKNTCQETGTLAKSASGALDIIPIVRVANLVSAINLLKKNDFWIVGLDGDCEKTLSQLDIPQKTALILGSEGDGMRRLTLENCDFIAKLPISDKIESLNVSNAAAIAFYEIASQRT